MQTSRRTFIGVMGALGAGILTRARPAHAAEKPLALEIAVRSPWMANQVALTRHSTLFLGLPRYAADKPTPSLARLESDGTLAAFPGNSWNEWAPGKDGREAFVYLNSVHIFEDDTIWCVDQGSVSAGVFPAEYAVPQTGAQKLVQLDSKSGAILRIIRFDDTILPPGAQMNDLRFHGNKMYISDSGLGGIIIHDLQSGKTVRRLSGKKALLASAAKVPAILAHVKGGNVFHPPNSDMIEITSDGKWLYWAAPTGPLYRLETRLLNDADVSEEQLQQAIERVYDNNFAGGCCMDSLGNVYFSETITHNITLLSPSGKTAVIASGPELVRPDGSFISHDRKLYIPVKQPAPHAGSDAPFIVYSITLPEEFDGIKLGGPVRG